MHENEAIRVDQLRAKSKNGHNDVMQSESLNKEILPVAMCDLISAKSNKTDLFVCCASGMLLW